MTRPKKFLIVSAQLRDYLCHHLERAVALAEAARRAGMRPALAAHIHCRTYILPTWLETHACRYPDRDTEHHSPPMSLELYAASRLRRSLAELSCVSQRLCGTVERAAFYALPPLLYDLARLARYSLVPRVAQASDYERVWAIAKKRASARRRGVGGESLLPAQIACSCEIDSTLREYRLRPEAIALCQQLLRTETSEADLVGALEWMAEILRLLAQSNIGSGDHVFVDSAQPRDLIAISLVIKHLGESRSPMFHLEFLDGLSQGRLSQAAPREASAEHGWSTSLDRFQGSRRIRLYCDSKCSARAGQLSLLPIPFRAELLSRSSRAPSAPVQLAYLGEARDEKGFPWLPDLAAALLHEYLRPGRARLLVQANVSRPQENPKSVEALERLRAFSPGEVELFATHAPLSPREYYRMASRADVVLLPYVGARYRTATAGVLAEALALGVPVVVPADTWMARQVPAGGGRTFAGFGSFVRSVKEVVDTYRAHRAVTDAFRSTWLKRHSPDAFLSALTCTSLS